MSDLPERRGPGLAEAASRGTEVPDHPTSQLPTRSGGTGLRNMRGQEALTIAHVADSAKLYPGDSVRLITQVAVNQAIAGYAVRILIPDGLVVDYYRGLDTEHMPRFEVAQSRTNGGDGQRLLPRLDLAGVDRYLVWHVAEAQPPGVRHEYEIRATVNTGPVNTTLRSTAYGYVGTDTSELPVDSESLDVSVGAQGDYLRYLPALFEQDDFMGRFLMLFESFWRPLDRQIGGIHHYFDPQLTPARFLPWLASWFDLTFDEFWSEAQQRRILGAIIRLYRKRGTKQALQEYLEIFTNHPVQIVEHRANNFQLGPRARLGAGVALGTANVPHSFTVYVRVDPLPPPADATPEEAARELSRLSEQRRKLIEQLIETEKPTHTRFLLEIETVGDAGEQGAAVAAPQTT